MAVRTNIRPHVWTCVRVDTSRVTDGKHGKCSREARAMLVSRCWFDCTLRLLLRAYITFRLNSALPLLLMSCLRPYIFAARTLDPYLPTSQPNLEVRSYYLLLPRSRRRCSL
jgi:hypothetical protein